MGHKMVKLHPIHGFAAETSSATILTLAAHFGMPVSTTHSISTAIMGVGFAKNPRALRLGVIERIVWAWILTIPAAGSIAYGLFAMLPAAGIVRKIGRAHDRTPVTNANLVCRLFLHYTNQHERQRPQRKANHTCAPRSNEHE